jgi:hypothetical protein
MKIPQTLAALAALSILALLAHPAQAAVTLIAQDSTAQAGGSGSFEVDLVNTGTTPYQVSGFNFELSLPSDSGVTFTDAEFNTAAPYIFSGNSFDEANGLTLAISSLPTTDLLAGDSVNTKNSFTTVSPGDTFGLGNISYNVALGTGLGPVTVSFENNFNSTFLADGNGDNNTIPFTTQNGTILVTPNISPAPEPSQVGMLALVGIGLGGLLLSARRRAA